MINVCLIRTAALELSALDDKDVVKVAGILRRMKNWWKAFNDPKYKKQVDKLNLQSSKINSLLSDLRLEINKLQSAISDTDVEAYEESLRVVRGLSSNLAAALKTYHNAVEKSEQIAPEQTVEIPTAEDTPEAEGSARVTSYTTKQLQDPAIRQQLANQLPTEYDVPLNQIINAPVTNYTWFSSLRSEDFYLSEDFVHYFQKALSEVLALRKIRLTGDPNQDLAIYSMIVQSPEVERQIRMSLPTAAIDGKLIRVDFQKPSNQVSRRNANDMLTVIQTAPFDIFLPATEYFESPKKLTINAVVLFNDMRAAYVSGQHLSAAAVKNLRIIQHDFPAIPQSIEALVRLRGIRKLSQQNIHAWARQILHDAFVQEMGREPTVNELQAAQAVAWLETNYGRGWGHGKIWLKRHKDLGITPDPRALNSNNWGAIQTRSSKPPGCSGNAFRYVDSRPTSSGAQIPYVICFKTYASPVEGAKDLIATLYKGKAGRNVLNAANSGSIVGFSSAMYDRHYYEGFGKTPAERIAGHVSVVNKALQKINKNVGENTAFDVREKPSKMALITEVQQHRKTPTAPGSVIGLQKQPSIENNIMSEYQLLLKQLSAAKSYGPVERLVRRALEREVLPTNNLLLVLSKDNSLPMRLRYARILVSALREELGAEASIHHKNSNVEIECDIVGKPATAIKAVQVVTDNIAKKFADQTNVKIIKAQNYCNLRSQLPLLDPHVSEKNFRKFAFEMMGKI